MISENKVYLFRTSCLAEINNVKKSRASGHKYRGGTLNKAAQTLANTSVNANILKRKWAAKCNPIVIYKPLDNRRRT